ncbi:MAG: hypothetical protein K2H52_16095 [Lachnospiraceae bacterium]|nr:hypothetical protein [Lachnospiraceae bacterium]MDE6185464.1 hypothetical protein [Lachnospiraceae bacterium]MDE7286602.1 hypothetical protein [Lachnospiraceae bacterium]
MSYRSIVTFRNIQKILKYIKEHPSREGALAKRDLFRHILIIVLILRLAMIPIDYAMSLIMYPKLPDGVSQEVRGHIARYDRETFWYTDSSQKYEFDLKQYTDDNTFEEDEIISVYLDENNQVIGVSHKSDEVRVVSAIIFSLLFPIIVLLAHAFIGKKTYCKYWSLYCQWYDREVEALN